MGFLKRLIWKRLNLRCWNCDRPIGQLFWEWIPPHVSDSPWGRHVAELGIRNDPLPEGQDVVLLCDECGARLLNDPTSDPILRKMSRMIERKIADV